MEPCSGGIRFGRLDGLLSVNVSVRFSGDMATVMVVAPVWHLLANVSTITYYVAQQF